MKYRSGFVSNSSSSSFVVHAMDFWDKNHKRFITEKEEKLLLGWGFKKTFISHAPFITDEIFEKGHASEKIGGVELYNYACYVSCNQDDVIYLLLKHNIPFEASCHYNHYHIIYRRDEQVFLEIQNYGEQASMRCKSEGYKDICTKEFRVDISEPIKKVNVKKWLKKEEKFQKELDLDIKDGILIGEDK